MIYVVMVRLICPAPRSETLFSVKSVLVAAWPDDELALDIARHIHSDFRIAPGFIFGDINYETHFTQVARAPPRSVAHWRKPPVE
jgi:hypothetical protein